MKRAFVILCLLAGVAHAEPDAEQLYKDGQTAYDAKNYDAALAAWTKSYELSKLPALVFNIAQAHRLRGDCADAVASYKKFIQLDPSSGERPDAEGFIRDLEPKCPAVKPPPIVTQKPIDNTKQPPIVEQPHPGGHGKRLAAYVAGGVGIAAVITGGVFGNIARGDANDVKKACAADHCTWDEIKSKDADGRSAETKQYILLGVGAAALATAGVLYYLGRDHGVAVTPHHDGGAISWTHRF